MLVLVIFSMASCTMQKSIRQVNHCKYDFERKKFKS